MGQRARGLRVATVALAVAGVASLGGIWAVASVAPDGGEVGAHGAAKPNAAVASPTPASPSTSPETHEAQPGVMVGGITFHRDVPTTTPSPPAPTATAPPSVPPPEP